MIRVLALDVGTTETGACLIEYPSYRPVDFGKLDNEELMNIVGNGNYDILVYEEFQCYGMPIGQSTIKSITWNGRYIQKALDLGKTVDFVYRKDEKINLCKTMKAKDSNIRQALIDRFGDVGNKQAPGFFYGFKKDIWSAYAVGVTYLDKVFKEC